MTDLAEAQYYDPAKLTAELWRSFLPPERVSVADYAAGHRWLANEGGGYVGRWEHAQAPYLVEPMECLTSLDWLTVAVVGPGQSGKTSIAENWLLSSVANDPADMLWYMQTDDGLSAYVKSQIDPMVIGHDELKRNLGLRAVDDSIHFKRFRGMRLEFLSATYANLINKRAPRIVADEIDAYPESLGDVKVLLDIRRQTYGLESMLLALSHCDRARGLDADKDWTDGIASIYADSDRRIWYWPCPHCNGWSSPHPLGRFVMELHYDAKAPLDEIETAARLLCPHCGTLIEDVARRAMNRAGRWIGDGQTIERDGAVTGDLVRRRCAGFWIVGLMSPFMIGGLGGLARARVKAERDYEASGDDQTLREVVVKKWGLPYTPPRVLGTLDANAIAANADKRLTLGKVPAGVRFLTAFVDVQDDRFEILVRGWGPKGESWVVDFDVMKAAPATDAGDWDTLIARLAKPYPLADESGRVMAIRGAGFDSAGAPGVTQQAGDAWLRAKARGRVTLYGKISGREAWSLIATKGATGFAAARLAVTYPDTQRKGRLASHGTVPQLIFNPNLFKDDLAGQLGVALGGAWSVHFPAALKSSEPPHAWFEQLIAEHRSPLGRWEKEHAGVRNEALDLMVGTHAVARLHGVGRIDWDQPPPWAADWDANSMVVDPAAMPPTATPSVASPAKGPVWKRLA